MREIQARFQDDLGAFKLNVALTAPGRGVTALFGHSGSGKTTVLRCVAGLHRSRVGALHFLGECWQNDNTFLPTHKRPIGYVFQEASLFPHMTVRGNLDFAVKRAKGAHAWIAFDEVVALLGVEPLLERAPIRLSGGERQRVGMARALLTQPRLLLMDEPLAALDRLSKQEILPYLESLHDRLEIPTLYVSHDLDEVERLADHMCYLEHGEVKLAGPIESLLTHPDLPFAKDPVAGVVLRGKPLHYEAQDHLTRIEIFPGFEVYVPGALQDREACRLRILAAHVSLSLHPLQGSSILNHFPVRITDAQAMDEARMNVRITLGHDGPAGPAILARITKKSWREMALAPGKTLFAHVKSVSLVDD
ncbi:molybdate ABC transporter, ATPase subunit [Magnetococcus marinus MC-1]|uniref:Molybdate ABC transporter, ATPase subunit n=1 Tax=Magnetococcus marinus (strain ATCC BAA-1437 / JCM 17883 / MC-1) TaxID=156889 RepID=A0L6V1_MAGMM|nr:molybdenum ABC transporter ATP-binding protein [Magnetococcus marinus]ABK43694.1 molybdate ABC transporter, ATPase subunit [Magnetococcus marinus MC-1]